MNAVLALALLAAAAPSPPHKLPPVEQCAGDKSFTAFRTALKDAAARKDQAALLALLSPDVIVSFGGDNGREAFVRQWSFDATEYGNLWDQLATMLRLGCAKSEGTRMIPSLAAQFDGQGDEDMFEKAVVVTPGAKLRKGPEIDSPVIATLAWDVVAIIDSASDLQSRVRTVEGREGWLSDDELYSPIGHRMVIQKIGGKWMITAFVAGD